MTLDILPTLIVEVGFSGPGTGTYLHLDDVVRGLLDTGTLAPTTLWTDVSEWVTSWRTSRGATRVAGPILRYETGTATIVLRNDDRRFDPTNLAGPYVSGGVTQVEPMRAVRIRTTWDGVTYPIWQGYADEWRVAYDGPDSSYVILTAFDAFAVFASYDRGAVAAVGAGEDTGARIGRILDSINWPDEDRLISTGDSTVQATTLASNVLAELLLTADTELGELFMDSRGRVLFRNRLALLEDDRSATPQARFGEGGTTSVVAATDTFSRTASSGWGSADTGQAWTRSGGSASDFSVADGVGLHSLGSVNASRRCVLAVTDPAEMSMSVSSPVVATGAAIRAAVMLRVVDAATDHYRAQLGFELGGALTLSLVVRSGGADSTLASTTLPITYAAGTQVRVRGQVDGSTLRAMAWLVGSPEPAVWHVTATDATHASGPPGVRTILATGNTNSLPVVVSVDDVSVGTAGGLTELPYQDVTLSYDAQSIYNRISIARTGGSAQVAENTASQTAYLTRTYTRTDLLHESDAESLDYAGYLLHQVGEPELRIAEMELRPGLHPEVWPEALGREIGDRLTVLRRPPGGGDPIERDVILRGIEHDRTAETAWRVRWVFQSASRLSFFVLDDPILGTLDENALAY